MKTICLDPVTPPLLIAGHLSFVTVDRPPPPADCDCYVAEGVMVPHSIACASLGPSPWIGQRVAIYAGSLDFKQRVVDRLGGAPHLHHEGCIHNLSPDEQIAQRGRTRDWWVRMGLAIPEQIDPSAWITSDAIVGSGTLAEACPIYGNPEFECDGTTHFIVGTDRIAGQDEPWLWFCENSEVEIATDLLPLQDWSPGRWALRFADVAPVDAMKLIKQDYGAAPMEEDPEWLEHMLTRYTVLAPVLSGDDPTYREWRTT